MHFGVRGSKQRRLLRLYNVQLLKYMSLYKAEEPSKKEDNYFDDQLFTHVIYTMASNAMASQLEKGLPVSPTFSELNLRQSPTKSTDTDATLTTSQLEKGLPVSPTFSNSNIKQSPTKSTDTDATLTEGNGYYLRCTRTYQEPKNQQ